MKEHGESVTKVFMGGMELMKTTRSMEAVMCLMGASYIFHTEYPPALKRTLTFFQYEVLKVGRPNDKKDSAMKAFTQ